MADQSREFRAPDIIYIDDRFVVNPAEAQGAFHAREFHSSDIAYIVKSKYDDLQKENEDLKIQAGEIKNQSRKRRMLIDAIRENLTTMKLEADNISQSINIDAHYPHPVSKEGIYDAGVNTIKLIYKQKLDNLLNLLPDQNND